MRSRCLARLRCRRQASWMALAASCRRLLLRRRLRAMWPLQVTNNIVMSYVGTSRRWADGAGSLNRAGPAAHVLLPSGQCGSCRQRYPQMELADLL